MFPNSIGIFNVNGLSDHSPNNMLSRNNVVKRKCLFNFFNYLANHEKFIPPVKEA